MPSTIRTKLTPFTLISIRRFDKIDHYILLKKLHDFGFSDSLCRLFSSYLIERKLFVKYQNFSSQAFSPTSGVPQSSNLGPLLFLLFINDLPDRITSEKNLFADDLKLFQRIVSPQDCVKLQHNIDIVVQWCHENRLTLNEDKCSVVSYTKKLVPVTVS